MNHEEAYLDLQLPIKDLGGVAFIFTLINRTVDANNADFCAFLVRSRARDFHKTN